MGWSYNEEDRRQMDTKNSGIDFSRNKTCSRDATDWAGVFVALMDQLNSQLLMSNGSGPQPERSRRSSILISWMTLARDRSERKQCYGLHDE
ncbi:unnamed protein product [Strongylus vulgaris]|uniref:Uncharacterized protein n=1 Tax=Strongylus vulgaris TaxID=40348 RepID=A0A3P7LI46_STRVU|nr:unnamed protein product [Strongylus vulgaris]